MRVNLLANHFDPFDGYGRHALHLMRSLGRMGVAVYPILRGSEVHKQGAYPDAPTIGLLYGDYIEAFNGRQWAYTMWEDTYVNREWVERINTYCERLIVPCPHNVGVFRDGGVTVPIHVVHEGIDPTEFPLIERPKRDVYTFMCLGDRGLRKGWHIATLAFSQAFPTETDVRLIIKQREPQGFKFGDERIQHCAGDASSMLQVYEMADCFVFPSCGEGWGLPPREAASTGLPVIATRWGGLDVGIDCWALPINNFRMMQSMMGNPDGQWALPDTDEVAKLMRWCYDNQDKARQMGQFASAWLRSNQTWEHASYQMKTLLEEYGHVA